LEHDIHPVGVVVVVGGKYELASINEVFCQKLGYEKAELAGTNFLDITCPAEKEKCKRLLLQAVNDKDAAYKADVRFVRKNGERVRVKLTAITALHDDQTAGHVLVTVEDFIGPPDHKTSSNAKRLAQVQASAQILMHELRNQIHTLSLIARSLEHEGARRGLVEDDSLVVLNQDLLMRLKDLRLLVQDFDRLGETVELKLQATDLVKFVTAMLGSKQASYYVGERIRVDFDMAADLPLVQLDRHRFKQAWLNLFKNAVEAMPSGGTITVRLYRSNTDVFLEIEDTGIGVPEGIDVFEPFTTTKPQGTGLGLGIVREIVSAHGGDVSYESTGQSGTRFRISLPLNAARGCDCEQS
jgi:PAS domain S-box-containing protein